MPKRDYGIFTSAESAYSKPGDFERSVVGEATKQGSYLSSMDQFYTQLDEMTRQFGEKMDFERDKLRSEEKMQDEMLGWYREQETGRLELSREQIQAQKYVAGKAGGGRSDTAMRQEAASFDPWGADKDTRDTRDTVPLDWMSEQMERMYPSSGGSPSSNEQSTSINFGDEYDYGVGADYFYLNK